MSDLENQVTEVEEAKVPHTGGSGVPAAEVPEPVAKSASKRKGDKDAGEKATPKLPGTKAGMLAAMMNVMSGKKMIDLQSMYSDMAEQTEEEDVQDTVEIDVSEDIASMLENGDYTEEFVENIQTIFKAAVEAKVIAEKVAIEEQYEEMFEQKLAEAVEEVTGQVDEYLSYAVNEWKEENEVAIESGIRAQLAENFIEGLHTLFTEHYVNIPEDKVDVVSELATRVEELEEKLNESIDTEIELKKELTSFKVDGVFDEVVEGLADTQVEKMRTFAEGIEYSDEQDFRSKLEVVRENYFPSKSPEEFVAEEELDDPVDQEETVVNDPAMSVYADAIRRTIRK